MLWPFLRRPAPKVSVIIPCYNQGRYLAESVRSVNAQSLQDFEIIVVNDGSTEAETKDVLATFRAPKTRIVHSQNQGVSAARNLGISQARGRYILPLDCDDRIAPDYLARATALLDDDPQLGIVYCQAEFFGFQSGPWDLPPFKFPEFILQPCIFCSAFFRREDWQVSGGYNIQLKHGFEDHDFWLELVKRGRTVHRIDEVLFHYRRRPDSVTHALTYEKHVGAFMTIFARHQKLFIDNIEVLIRGYLAREALAQAHSEFPTIQLFADAGRGYTEPDSIRTRFASGAWVTVDLPLPAGARTDRQPLRLDPGMQEGCYDITEIALLQRGALQASIDFSLFQLDAMVVVEGTAFMQPRSDGLRVFSYGTDPRLLLIGLPITEPIDTLRVRIRYQTSAETAVAFFETLPNGLRNLPPAAHSFATQA